MLIIGHPLIAYRPFYLIKKVDDIAATGSGESVIFSFCEDNLPLVEHCRNNGVTFALICDNKQDILLAQALGCGYIVCDKGVVEAAQKFADGYLFDAKILLYSSDSSDLLWAGEREIDGILFEEGIDYGSC